MTVGPHVARVAFETGDINLNWRRFVEQRGDGRAQGLVVGGRG